MSVRNWQKRVFLDVNQQFLLNFVFFQKISKLRQPNFSEIRENEKFGKFRLMQGLNF